MFTNKIASYYSQGKVLVEAACLSTDTKPTTGVANGSKCIEMDTGKKYMFNEEDSEWEELPSSGGGGGGGTTVEELSVTQNGTYTAPSGKAYSPVTVNVSGGSSDFSTAEVVVTIGSNIDVSMEGICILNDGDVDYLGTSYPISTDDTSVINAVLYKNEGSVTIQTTGTVTVTGNIRQMSPTDYLITGDCTITIITIS